MADGDGTAVNVHLGRIKLQFLDHTQRLGGEGFVRFDKVQILDRPTGLFQRAGRGRDRAGAHDGRIHTGGRPRGDAGQRFQTAPGGFLGAHQHQGCRPVVDARGVGCRDRAILGEGRTQLLHGLDGGTVADVFVLIDNDVALAVRYGDRDDLVSEFAGLLCGLGLVLAGDGELVLFVAAQFPLVSNVLGGLAHVVAVEGIQQAVTQHVVFQGDRAHLVPVTQDLQVGSLRHGFLTTDDHDLGVALSHLLIAQSHGAQARAAQLVQRPGSGFLADARIDRSLTSGALTCTSLQHLPQDNLVHLFARNTGTLQRAPDGDLAQLGRWKAGKRAEEGADRGSGGRDDNDFGHGYSLHREILCCCAAFRARRHP